MWCALALWKARVVELMKVCLELFMVLEMAGLARDVEE